MVPMQLRIGVTGGIGSGKSYICSLLGEKGYPVYDCDANAKRIMTTDSTTIASLIHLLGPQVYVSNSDVSSGKRMLNKPFLASYIFQSAHHAKQVNAIVHPAVKHDFLQWASRQRSAIVFMESAILFESGFNDVVDRVLLVQAPVNVRIQRAMQRDGVSSQKIEERIKSQATEQENVERADDFLINDGQRDVNAQLDELLKKWNALL